MANNNLYSYLFETRFNLLDENFDERSIIKELKYILIDHDISLDDINQTLYDFYKFYDIDISLEEIEDVITVTNVLSNTFIQLINTFVNNEQVLEPIQELEELPPLEPHQHFLNVIDNILHNFNDNVVVSLDDDEVAKLETFKLEDNIEPSETCSICMDPLEKGNIIIKLKCTHMFHKDCIYTHLTQYNYKCPLCRNEVGKPKYNI
jgi:hypothetical protein